MTRTDDQTSGIAAAWDTYWHGAREGGAFGRRGAGHPSVLAFWHDYFRGLHQQSDDANANVAALRLLDIASGNGAVIDCAREACGALALQFTCVDISQSAVAALQERLPDARALVADARNIPLAEGSFDIVTSQYGLEYAGDGALQEAARLVAPGGEIALLLHHAGGHIFAQCAQSLDAVRRLQAARFLPLCRAMFEAAFAARDGGDPESFRQAGAAFAPALRAVESLMQQYGRDVADGTLVRLYRDVRTIHQRLRQYDAADVRNWLSAMGSEIESYAGRMASMCDAATDTAGFDAMCSLLRERGFEILRRDALEASDLDGVLAWALIARRSGE